MVLNRTNVDCLPVSEKRIGKVMLKKLVACVYRYTKPVMV